MNRKLKHTILAFSTTGLLLVVGLMAAQPLPTAVETSQPLARVAPVVVPDDASRRDAAIEARAQRFESEVAQAKSVDEALALSTAFVAEVAAVSAIQAVFTDGAADVEADSDAEAREPTPERKQRRKVRSAIALPYFSFARGLRGTTGS